MPSGLTLVSVMSTFLDRHAKDPVREERRRHIAYQVTGEGPFDLVLVPGFVSHLEFHWEDPGSARFLERLASFARLICFDKRGTGLSDRVGATPTSSSGWTTYEPSWTLPAPSARRSSASPRAARCAALRRDLSRTHAALVLDGTFARRPGRRLPVGLGSRDERASSRRIERDWGGPVGVDDPGAEPAGDDRFAIGGRASCAWPRARAPRSRSAMNWRSTCGQICPRSACRRSIFHRTGDRGLPSRGALSRRAYSRGALGRAARRRSSALCQRRDQILDEVEEFLTGSRHGSRSTACWQPSSSPTSSARPSARRRSATDAGGTCSAGHYATVRRELARFRGREVDTAGDGFLAPSTARRAPSACARPSAPPSDPSASKCARGFTPASAR